MAEEGIVRRVRRRKTVAAGSSDAAAQSENMSTTELKSEEVNVGDLIGAIMKSLGPEPPKDSDIARDNIIQKYLAQKIVKHKIAQEYNILILHDENRMVKADADKIYSAATEFGSKKPILLILYSAGGIIGSAYLIGKLCQEYAKGKFITVVPRQAKSAATLLCCAADEIHMGSLSELGPIDPQIDNLPALGLKSSVEHIADLMKNYPMAAELFAKYLKESLNPLQLGYYERVAESAAQYAEKLLKAHLKNPIQEPKKIALSLVYSYKDHGFVIDKSEATEIFGGEIVKKNTPEYDLGNAIYKELTLISRVADYMNHLFYFIGSCESKPNFHKK